jgi:hypothetical protein
MLSMLSFSAFRQAASARETSDSFMGRMRMTTRTFSLRSDEEAGGG